MGFTPCSPTRYRDTAGWPGADHTSEVGGSHVDTGDPERRLSVWYSLTAPYEPVGVRFRGRIVNGRQPRMVRQISGEGSSTGDQHAHCEVGTFAGHSRRLMATDTYGRLRGRGPGR